MDQENLQVEVDNVSPSDVGSYTLTLDQYMSTSSWSIDFCEIDPVPSDILLPTNQQLTYTIDDDCMVTKDVSLSHCQSCPTCSNGYK